MYRLNDLSVRAGLDGLALHANELGACLGQLRPKQTLWQGLSGIVMPYL